MSSNHLERVPLEQLILWAKDFKVEVEANGDGTYYVGYGVAAMLHVSEERIREAIVYAIGRMAPEIQEHLPQVQLKTRKALTTMTSTRYRIATFHLTIQKADRITVQRQLHEIGMPTHAIIVADRTPAGSSDETRDLVLDWDLSTIDEHLQPVLDDFGASEPLPTFERQDAIKRLNAIYERLRAIAGISCIYVRLGDEIIFN